MWMSARLGGAFTPGLVFLCLQYVTWRMAFLLFGLLGVVWAIIFFSWYRDDPRAVKQVNAAERHCGGGCRGRPSLQSAVEAAVYLSHGLVPVWSILRVQLQLLFLHHLVPDLPAGSAAF
jgi:MFS family permease